MEDITLPLLTRGNIFIQNFQTLSGSVLGVYSISRIWDKRRELQNREKAKANVLQEEGRKYLKSAFRSEFIYYIHIQQQRFYLLRLQGWKVQEAVHWRSTKETGNKMKSAPEFSPPRKSTEGATYLASLTFSKLLSIHVSSYNFPYTEPLKILFRTLTRTYSSPWRNESDSEKDQWLKKNFLKSQNMDYLIIVGSEGFYLLLPDYH